MEARRRYVLGGHARLLHPGGDSAWRSRQRDIRRHVGGRADLAPRAAKTRRPIRRRRGQATCRWPRRHALAQSPDPYGRGELGAPLSCRQMRSFFHETRSLNPADGHDLDDYSRLVYRRSVGGSRTAEPPGFVGRGRRGSRTPISGGGSPQVLRSSRRGALPNSAVMILLTRPGRSRRQLG